MRLRTKLAIFMAKLIHWTVKLLRRGDGVALPGYIARLIDPDILRELSGIMREKMIVVMGTNGKTTTNSILNHILVAEGRKVIINKTGANMRNGITGAFALAADWKRGRLQADYACIEVDENASVSLLPELRPECIVLTNIFRDQLDRYGEVDIVRNKLKAAFSSVPDAKLLLNCDDVISYSLSYECKNPVITYGINEQIFDHRAGTGSRESIFCRLCGTKLEYDTIYYGQSGIWHCPHCGAGRPEPSYRAENVSLYNRTYSFEINGMPVNTKARAPYNVYNTLAACAALYSMGEGAQFAKAIETFDYGNNREDIFHILGSCVQLHLAKNPAGFQQKLSLILQDKKQKDIIIQINDTAQDGRDVSWLWDVDFQMLAAARASTISIGGTRRHDMGLRLKYEDIPHRFTADMKSEVQRLAGTGTGNLYVIVNYSGLSETRRLLLSLQKEQGSRAARLVRDTATGAE